MGGTYRAWNDTIRRWPPPNGWYRADDGRWWAPGTGPNPPGRRPPPGPRSPAVRADPTPRSSPLLNDDTPRESGTGLDASGTEPNRTGNSSSGAAADISLDHQPPLGIRTADTALLPLTASPTAGPIVLRRKPRLITRFAVVLTGAALGLATCAGVVTALVATGHIDELPSITINRPAATTAAPTPAAEPAPIEPWTFERTTVTTTPIVSEPRLLDEPTQQIARFGELVRIDEVATGPGPEDDVRSGLGG